MQIKLVLCTVALFVYLRGVTSLNRKHQDASLSQQIIVVYISLLSDFNLTWIDDVTTRVAPVRHVYNITHLVLTLVDCGTTQATLITETECSATTYNLPIDTTECKSEKLNELFQLTLSLDILYKDTVFLNISSVFGLTHPTYSVLSVVPKNSLFLDENRTETILNLIYENFPLKFNAVFFLINESISSHSEYYGSPLYEDTYADGTGFNEAVTITNIPQTERDTSLQYHLLSSGVYTRVCSYQQLDSSRNSLFLLLHHFLTNYFVSNDDFVRLDVDSSECVDTLLCPGYSRTSCEDDILNKLNVKQLDKVNWNMKQPFIEFLFENNEPTVLVNTSVLEWPALQQITFENLPSIFPDKEHHNVKNTEFRLTFDPDFEGTKLRSNITLPYQKISLTKDELSHAFTHKSADKGNYLFTKITPSQLQYFSPNEMLFHTYEDWLSAQQFLWVSSGGLATHLHIDMDWNCFVQIRGKKRFTLFPPSQHQLMYMYPRVHPMWHKSKIDLDHFSGKFSNFLITSPLQVVLEPGDLLFIPGYTWHYVESLTPSISLSTWSHDTQLRAHMEAVYNHDHKFDLLFYKQGTVLGINIGLVANTFCILEAMQIQ